MMKWHINSEQAYRMIAHKRGPSYKKHGVETHASCVTRHFLKPGKEILKGTRASVHSAFSAHSVSPQPVRDKSIFLCRKNDNFPGTQILLYFGEFDL